MKPGVLYTGFLCLGAIGPGFFFKVRFLHYYEARASKQGWLGPGC